MNKTIDQIKSHRSIRRFSDQAISEELLFELVASGQSASTSSYIQAVSLVRITDSSIRGEFVELTGGQKYVESAAEFLVFCADWNRNDVRVKQVNGEQADFSWTEQFLAATVDVALFAQNLVIAAESLGLGCCYIGGIRNDPARVAELLDLPELVYPVFGLCLGYPDQNPDIKPRLPQATIIHTNQYTAAHELRSELDKYDARIRAYYKQRTGGKLDLSWSEQMAKQAQSQSRPFLKEFLNSKGFMQK